METTDCTDLRFDYYLKKIENHPKMQHFFKIIPVPKCPTLFKLLVMLLFSQLEIIASSHSIYTFFLPSILCIIFLWFCQMAINSVFVISEECLLEEIMFQQGLKDNPEDLLANFPDDPLYVTEEDRKSFIDSAIMDYKNHPFKWRLKNHKISLFTTILYYCIVYIALKYLYHEKTL